ncbi:MAG: SusD family outer membrane lipoprotein NanU [Haliscomenobacter sp.]
MKKFIIYILVLGASALGLSACQDQLDLAPISSISDGNYWQTPDQYDAFLSGVHNRFRSHTAAFQILGELRSDIFGTEPGNAGTFTGEATQGVERLWQQTLDMDNPGVSNFGGFYSNIGQLNLLISKLNTTSVLPKASKDYYLGIAYGMRAYYYFHLVRTWGDVVIQTEPVTSFEISSLAKDASPASEVMNLIKSDIAASLASFGSDYSFKNQKGYWSKAATLMLNAEFSLWNAHRGGGAADATAALTALNDIQSNVSGLALRPTFISAFAAGVANKGNSEIIFAIRNLLNESTQPFSGTFLPQTSLLANYYDSLENRKFSVVTDNWGGLLRAPVKSSTYRMFSDQDTRKRVSIQAAYTSPSAGTYVMAGCFVKKYEGEQDQGSRKFTNDYPIYRYADLLLMQAEAKVLLGQSPATELNLVRARAYGTAYDAAVHGYPNQPTDADAKEALLRERLFEFVFEGKRWYDLRRFGDSYVYKYTAVKSSEAYKLLWPIDRNSLTNNRSLKQNPGYPSF